MFNIWSILAATIAGFLLGGIWYGPLFGQAWMKAIGKTADELEPSPMPYSIIMGAILAVWQYGICSRFSKRHLTY